MFFFFSLPKPNQIFISSLLFKINFSAGIVILNAEHQQTGDPNKYFKEAASRLWDLNNSRLWLRCLVFSMPLTYAWARMSLVSLRFCIHVVQGAKDRGTNVRAASLLMMLLSGIYWWFTYLAYQIIAWLLFQSELMTPSLRKCLLTFFFLPIRSKV